MKKQNLVLVIITFFLVTWLPCQADDILYVCAQKNKGSLRLVDDYNQCLKSEYPVTLNGFAGYIVELGSIEGMIGAGQFTTSSEIPIGISFSYGYPDATDTSRNQVYIFDDFIIPETGVVIDLNSNDDPQFNQVVNAIKNGLPPGSAFYAALGFHPSPPFLKRGAFYDSSPIIIPQNSRIRFLRLIIDPFTITSPSYATETLWEISLTHFKIVAFGSPQ